MPRAKPAGRQREQAMEKPVDGLAFIGLLLAVLLLAAAVAVYLV